MVGEKWKRQRRVWRTFDMGEERHMPLKKKGNFGGSHRYNEDSIIENIDRKNQFIDFMENGYDEMVEVARSRDVRAILR